MTDHLQEAKDILDTSIDPKCEMEVIAHALIAIAEQLEKMNDISLLDGEAKYIQEDSHD